METTKELMELMEVLVYAKKHSTTVDENKIADKINKLTEIIVKYGDSITKSLLYIPSNKPDISTPTDDVMLF